MAHLVSVPDDKRVSLDTVFVRPNQPFKVGVWGMAGDLKLVATKDNGWDKDVLKQTKDLRLAGAGEVVGAPLCKMAPLPVPPGKRDYAASQFTFATKGDYRIELRNGINVWDWMRISCDVAPPAALADVKKKGREIDGMSTHGRTRIPAPKRSPKPISSDGPTTERRLSSARSEGSVNRPPPFTPTVKV